MVRVEGFFILHMNRREFLKAGGAVMVMSTTLGGTVRAADPKADAPIAIGSRRELMVDDYLIDRMVGKVELRMHHPIPREVAITMDKPWEGNGSMYMTVFQDGKLYRMYYRGVHVVYTREGFSEPHEQVTCYAESQDGIHWTKPELGLVDFGGSKQNNIILKGPGITDNFTPFKDTNPQCKADERYKALGGGGGGLVAMISSDGIHWRKLREQPVITKGLFDSQNLAFWDSVRGEYREYHRDARDGRDIRTCTSKDFLAWSEPVFLNYSPSRVSELYTNQVTPYPRAPHLFLGFPTRYIERGWSPSMEALPQLDYRRVRAAKSLREGTALTDGMLMTSRDGLNFKVWPESFIRPGLRTKYNWFYGDNYQSWGLIETESHMTAAPKEFSFFASESYCQGDYCWWRRFTMRIDGFVSVQAPLSGGEFITKPLVFEGGDLALNFSTGAAGRIRIEIQDAAGKPLPGFALGDGPEIFGDALDRVAPWKQGRLLKQLSGKPVRLRFELRDADLYAFQFLA